MENEYIKGRGAQFNTKNKFLRQEIVKEEIEAIDEWTEANPKTQFIETIASSLVNKVTPPDVGMWYSMNPYMGCEHGCIYCYARNSFEYWGYSAGIDFESKILVKVKAVQLLTKFLMNPKWECKPISVSGLPAYCLSTCRKKIQNPQESAGGMQSFQSTSGHYHQECRRTSRQRYLQPMGKKNLVSVIVTITSLDEHLRQLMEPRTTTALQGFRVINELSRLNVKCGVMGGLLSRTKRPVYARYSETGIGGRSPFSAYTFIRLKWFCSVAVS